MIFDPFELNYSKIKAYLDWTRGDEGQKVVKDAGYYPLPPKLRATPGS